MPEGVLQWLDPDGGEGRILGRGRRYSVRIHDVEAEARHPGARVHFDVDHHSDGYVAVRVTLRTGAHVAPTQRRFGDLVGARTPETKVDEDRAEIEIGRDRVRHPVRVAQWWAEHVAAGHADDAVRLYSPTAVLQIEGDVAIGPDAIRAELLQAPMFDRGLLPDGIEGDADGEVIRVRWPTHLAGQDSIESHLVIERGEIIEQWQGEVRTIVDTAAGLGIDLSVEGDVPDSTRSYALDTMRRAAAKADRVRRVAIRLESLANPSCERRSRARATLDVDGGPVRAHASARTMEDAIDLLETRLTEQIRHHTSHRRAIRRRGPSSEVGEWRHGDWTPPHRQDPPLDPEDRTVIPRPTWSPEPCTFDEAVLDLESLDLEFLLFTDLASGQDAVVYRAPDGRYGVRLAAVADHGQRTASMAAIDFDPRSTPRISIEEARQHLDSEGEGWVFFKDLVTDRGHVLYRRDDGHDGLMTPRIDVHAHAPA